MAPQHVSGEYAVFTTKITFPATSFDEAQDASTPPSAEADVEHTVLTTISSSANRTALKADLATSIRKDLGLEVDIDDLIINPGSIEVIVIATTIYKVVKNFDDVMDTLQKAAENVRRIVKAFVDRVSNAEQTRATATVEPGSGLLRAAQARPGASERWSSTAAGSPLVAYLALSNLALIIGLLIFLALRTK